MRNALWKTSRLVVITTVGTALVVLGIVLIPLPGPGLLVILAGVAVLAREYRWARRLRDDLRTRARDLRRLAMERREARRATNVESIARTVQDEATAPDRHDIPA